jgi:hypothetical protein
MRSDGGRLTLGVPVVVGMQFFTSGLISEMITSITKSGPPRAT